MKDTNCDNCFYALPTVGDDGIPNVKCRRYPPSLLQIDGEVNQVYPDAVHRCGEYKEEG